MPDMLFRHQNWYSSHHHAADETRMRKSQIKSCGKTRSMSTSQAREINKNNKPTIHQTKIMLNNHLRCGTVIRCYNVDKEFKFTFISLNMGLKRREGGYHPSDVF